MNLQTIRLGPRIFALKSCILNLLLMMHKFKNIFQICNIQNTSNKRLGVILPNYSVQHNSSSMKNHLDTSDITSIRVK